MHIATDGPGHFPRIVETVELLIADGLPRKDDVPRHETVPLPDPSLIRPGVDLTG